MKNRITDNSRCAVSAQIVLNAKGAHVATVQTLYPRDGAGRLIVNVFNTERGLDGCCAAAHCWAAIVAMKTGKENGYKEQARELWGNQSATAGGYGYDKRTAALAGLVIDGHTLADNCGNVPEAAAAKDRLMKAYLAQPVKGGVVPYRETYDWIGKAAKLGARFANWRGDTYTSLHFEPGLSRLEMLGYTVIEAI